MLLRSPVPSPLTSAEHPGLGQAGRALPLPAAASGAPDVSFWRALGLIPGTKCTPALPGPMEFHPSELKIVAFCPKQRRVVHGEVALPGVAAGRHLV